jgi:hypothetical protein
MEALKYKNKESGAALRLFMHMHNEFFALIIQPHADSQQAQQQQ